MKKIKLRFVGMFISATLQENQKQITNLHSRLHNKYRSKFF